MAEPVPKERGRGLVAEMGMLLMGTSRVRRYAARVET